MPFISVEQLKKSLNVLSEVHPFFGFSMLAFKKANIPTGYTTLLNFTSTAEEILDAYYKPFEQYKAYYTPFKTSDKSNRWLKDRYASTSLQRITTDTFSDALIHTKGKTNWGWKNNYVEMLSQHLLFQKIPTFDLAVWLYRERRWVDGTTPQDIITYFFESYSISQAEKEILFNHELEGTSGNWLQGQAISSRELAETVGYPPNIVPDEGAAVKFFEVKYVGPAGAKFRYEPADRLNLITGDNGVGKTFVFEIMWWALTGKWLRGFDATPRRNVPSDAPQLSFGLTIDSFGGFEHSAKYDWLKATWELPTKKSVNPGLVIYSRYDGSSAIFDPNRPVTEGTFENPSIFLGRDEVWDGVSGIVNGQEKVICNGIVEDWVNWQTRQNLYSDEFSIFASCLSKCSASEVEKLEPGIPTRPPGEARFFPTIQTRYGEVIVSQASAGVKRILALVYTIVWAWYEHLRNSELIRKNPQHRIILMIDEVEAHLHPHWQRVIVPALMEVVRLLSNEALPQLHIATHSPLVLASVEPMFDELRDDVHHLYLRENNAVLEELPFVKRGPVDAWLMSDVFGLDFPRSVEASQALEQAKALQLQSNPSQELLLKVDSDLKRYLAPDDDFWPSWRFYALRAGLPNFSFR